MNYFKKNNYCYYVSSNSIHESMPILPHIKYLNIGYLPDAAQLQLHLEYQHHSVGRRGVCPCQRSIDAQVTDCEDLAIFLQTSIRGATSSHSRRADHRTTHKKNLHFFKKPHRWPTPPASAVAGNSPGAQLALA